MGRRAKGSDAAGPVLAQTNLMRSLGKFWTDIVGHSRRTSCRVSVLIGPTDIRQQDDGLISHFVRKRKPNLEGEPRRCRVCVFVITPNTGILKRPLQDISNFVCLDSDRTSGREGFTANNANSRQWERPGTEICTRSAIEPERPFHSVQRKMQLRGRRSF
jgi:hypothetical protein